MPKTYLEVLLVIVEACRLLHELSSCTWNQESDWQAALQVPSTQRFRRPVGEGNQKAEP